MQTDNYFWKADGSEKAVVVEGCGINNTHDAAAA